MPVIIRLFPVSTATRLRKRTPAIFASTNLSHLYFPGRGVFFSLALHAMVLAGLLYVPILPLPPVKPRPRQQIVVIDLTDPDFVMYLPMMGGGGSDPGLSGGNEEPGKKGAAAAPALSREGLSYPGPQPILSNPPNATNLIQTLLQPGLANPTVLKPPLPLPNAVLTTNADPIPPSPPSDPPAKAAEVEKPVEAHPVEQAKPQPDERLLDASLPAVEVKASTESDLSRMVLPADAVPPPLPKTASPDLTTLTPPPPVEPPPPPEAPPEPKPAPKPAPKKPEPESKVPEFKKPEPTPAPKKPEPTKPEPAQPASEKMKETLAAEAAAVPTSGRDSRNLLSLTPLPALNAKLAEIPDGEARGRFMISPDPNLLTSSTEPGTKTGTSTAEVNIGSFSSAQTGNATPVVNVTFGATIAAGGGGDTSAAGSGAGGTTGSGAGTGGGTGSGAGAKNGPGTGAGSGGGAGAGSGTGSGAGSGTGTGSGVGTGAGAGSGGGAFAGITIIGGVGNTGVASNSPAPARKPRPLQTSYGLYVVSTENSGGGLPYFGVFSHEQVYTVYLDMRRTEIDPVGPSWTLEFAVLQETSAQGNASEATGENQQGLILPFPAIKEPPALPAELVRKYLGKMVIVYALINVNGRMEQLSVKDSPDPLLNQPVIDALNRWVFRPAMLLGNPVPTKMLLGIPLWLPE